MDDSHAEAMTSRGFTLIELLVATLVTLAILGALAGLAGPMRMGFDRTLAAGEVSMGARAGIETLLAELRQSGTGALISPPSSMLADVTPTVVPRTSLDDEAMSAPFRALAVVGVPVGAGQGILRERAEAGSTSLQLEAAAPCPEQDGTCGFEPGGRAVLHDQARAEWVDIDGIAAGSATLLLITPLAKPFEKGAVVVGIDSAVYGLRSSHDGSMQLVRRTAAGAEQPIIDHVAEFDVALFGTGLPPQPGTREEDPPTYGATPPALGIDDERDSWAEGENCSLAVDDDGRRAPRLQALASPGALVPLHPSGLSDGPWCPDAADRSAFDADLLRVRRVDVRLRVEAASSAMRGPAGRLFRRSGEAGEAARWVPDLDLRVAVTLRNR